MSTFLPSEIPDDFLLTPPDELMRVKDFFKGRNVLITGGSGFMGKVLIEKLMWSCEEIGNVYLTLRAKKSFDVKKRLDELLNLEIFDRIKKRDPKSILKIIPVKSDIMEKDLGLSDEDKQMLRENVSVVFHVAASVRFEEPLNRAILINVRGTRDILELATGMKKLVAFVYVSTTYTNTKQKIIEERVYTEEGDWSTYIKMAELFQDKLNCFRHKVVGLQPNSYTFTKYLAENVVNDYRHQVPVIIFRPSIVYFCLKDPLPGWVGNYNGPIGIWLGVVTGVFHVCFCKAQGLSNYIPCDYAINALILSAWYRGNKKISDCVTINAACGDEKRFSPEYLFDLAYAALEKYPPEKLLTYPSFRGIRSYYVYIFLFVVQELIPGIMFDILFALKGINFRIVPIYRKLYSMNNLLYPFLVNQWEIRNENYYKLDAFMHPEDRSTFLLDINAIEDDKASYIMIKGFKKYLLKEECDKESIRRARKNFRRAYAIDRTVRGLIVIFIIWLIYKFMNYAYQTMYNLFSL